MSDERRLLHLTLDEDQAHGFLAVLAVGQTAVRQTGDAALIEDLRVAAAQLGTTKLVRHTMDWLAA